MDTIRYPRIQINGLEVSVWGGSRKKYWFSEKEFDVIMNRFLFVKLYFDTGVIKPWHNELLTECQKYYPEHFIKLHALKEAPDATAGQEWFRLLKGIANDVHACLRIQTEGNSSAL